MKLLRVLQTRTFQRLGDTRERRFQGKVIAATNRDLAAEMQAGRFRADLYYRLCADVIETPSLAGAAPRRTRTSWDTSCASWPAAWRATRRPRRWRRRRRPGSARTSGPEYPWPGNVRELEQCVRNVMIRGRVPAAAAGACRSASATELADAFLGGALTAESCCGATARWSSPQTGNYQETARRLGIDRRTVKERVDPALAERLRGES